MKGERRGHDGSRGNPAGEENGSMTHHHPFNGGEDRSIHLQAGFREDFTDQSSQAP
jgi:hypothetical protein